MIEKNAWRSFVSGSWNSEIDVRDFIQKNRTPYEGDDSFLAGATTRTQKLMESVNALLKEERQKGILEASVDVGTSITAHKPGYIDQALEKIVGLQTDAPLKRAIAPNGAFVWWNLGLKLMVTRLIH